MSQAANVLAHLKSGQPITALDSLKLFGCWRLSPRILELRQAGYRIRTRMVKTPTGKIVAEYQLAPDEE